MKNNFILGFLIALAIIFITSCIFSIYPGRYRYISQENWELDVPSSTRETEFIPYKSTGVFDTWTGKIYREYKDFRYIEERDLIRNKWNAIFFDSDSNISSAYTEELNRIDGWIKRKLNRQAQDRMDELIKHLLPNP